MLFWIYCRPLWQIATAILGLILLRGLLPKGRKYLNLALALLYASFVIWMTLLRRSGNSGGIYPVPFDTLSRAREIPELYREKLMNILFYVPFGLSLPFALPKRPLCYTVLLALGFTIEIEALQYIFNFGWAETDDVLCNTLGAFLGSLSFLLSKALYSRHK